MDIRQTAINSDYLNSLPKWSEADRALRLIAEAGFTHVNWCFQWEAEYLHSPSEFFQIRNALRHYDLKVTTVHAAEGGAFLTYADVEGSPRPVMRSLKDRSLGLKRYTSTNEYTRLAGVDLLKNRIDLCTHVGADALVVHLSLPYRSFMESSGTKEDYYRAAFRSFDELESYAKAAGVRLAIENLGSPTPYEEEKFERLFERYDSDYLGFCYDSGHAALTCLDNYYYYLEKYNSRLIAVHLHDNDSVDLSIPEKERGPGDKHRVPFSGVLDWGKIAALIAQSPLRMPADFEVVFHPADEEDEKAQLKDAHDKSILFHEMVEKCRG